MRLLADTGHQLAIPSLFPSEAWTSHHSRCNVRYYFVLCRYILCTLTSCISCIGKSIIQRKENYCACRSTLDHLHQLITSPFKDNFTDSVFSSVLQQHHDDFVSHLGTGTVVATCMTKATSQRRSIPQGCLPASSSFFDLARGTPHEYLACNRVQQQHERNLLC